MNLAAWYPITSAAGSVPASWSITLSELLSHRFSHFLNLSQPIHILGETWRFWWAACCCLRWIVVGEGSPTLCQDAQGLA